MKHMLRKLNMLFLVLVLTAGLFSVRAFADPAETEPGEEPLTEAVAQTAEDNETDPADETLPLQETESATETETEPVTESAQPVTEPATEPTAPPEPETEPTTETETEPPTEPVKYSITVTGGSVTHQQAVAGTRITVSDPVIPAGHTFEYWELKGLDFKTTNDRTFSFAMPSNDVVITLHTKAVLFKVTVSGGATADKTEATEGESVRVSAKYAEGEDFGWWEIADELGMEKITDAKYKYSYTLNMPSSDVTVTLHKTYLVKVEGGKAQSAGKNSSHILVGPGDQVTVSPHEASTKGFFAWLISGVGKEEYSYTENYTFTMPANAVTFKIQYGGTVRIDGGHGTAFPERAQEKTEVTVSQPDVPEGMLFDYWEIRGVKGLTKSEEEVFTFMMPANDVDIILNYKAPEEESTAAPSAGYYYIDRYRIHKSLEDAQAPEDFTESTDSGTFVESLPAFYNSDRKLYVYYADRGTDETADLYVYDACNTSLIPYTRFTTEDGRDFIVTTPLKKSDVPGSVQSEAKVAVSDKDGERIQAPGYVTVTEHQEKVNAVYLFNEIGRRICFVVYPDDGGNLLFEPYDEYVKNHVPETESESESETETESATAEPTETTPPAGTEQEGRDRNPYTFWIILAAVLLLLVIAAIILVIYYNRKQDDEELETDFDTDDPKEAFELFNRVKERDLIDSDYNQSAAPEEGFDVSFENAFPAEMGIAAAVREVDEEEDMPKKFTNDFRMEEIEDITDELVKMSAPEILASNTQKIELDPKDIEAAEKAAEAAEAMETADAAAVSEAAAGTAETLADAAAQTADAAAQTADAAAQPADVPQPAPVNDVESAVAAAVAATALAGAAAGLTEDIEDISADIAGDTPDEADARSEDAAEDGKEPASEDDKEETSADNVSGAEDSAAEGTEAATDEAPAEEAAEDPAITRLKESLSAGVKSDEEIAKGRSLKQVTYKDILMDDDFEEIEFRKGNTSEKET